MASLPFCLGGAAGLRPTPIVFALAAMAMNAAEPASAATFETLHAFTGGADGGKPLADLIMDAKGVLYGTTEAGGTGKKGVVFKLTPPKAGTKTWTETVIHTFTGAKMKDGDSPTGGLVMDKAGALYGITQNGGTQDNGTLYKLTPPVAPKTTWTETVLHNFTGGNDGSEPEGKLIMDAAGDLYGTTYVGGGLGAGVVFKLKKNAGKTTWTETVLHSFSEFDDAEGPRAGLVMDAAGALYGTTAYGGAVLQGAVFKLTPPKAGNGAWAESVIYSFTGTPDGSAPRAALIIDKGSLYGTTYEGGNGNFGEIFKLTPPAQNGGQWTETPIYSFMSGPDGANPLAPLALGKNGVLVGTATNAGDGEQGTLFKFTLNASATGGKLAVLHPFTGNGDGADPLAGVLVDAAGNLYGTTATSLKVNQGTVYKVTP